MKYTKLGNTNIEVSQVAVGCMSFGKASKDFLEWTIDPQQTQSVIEKALDLGMNFFDTANQYSFGTSEEYLGRSLRNLGISREKVVIATKVYFNLTTKEHLTRKAILAEVEGSLRRLGTDYIDLYQIHRFDYDTPIEETMETLNELVQSGKVRALGASAMYGYQFHNMQLCAEKHGWAKFETMQNHYNLLYREDERELIPICKQYGVSLIPYSPLAGGHLARDTWDSGSKRDITDQTVKKRYDKNKEEDLCIVKRVKEIADKHACSMSEIALAWLYAKGVAAPIVGTTKPKHYEPAVKAQEISLNKEEINYLEERYSCRTISGAR